MTLPFHPLANIFPLIEGAEFDELVASVKASCGPREAIVLFEGLILDGRNRARACEAADLDPRYEMLSQGADPLQFVIDKNLRRRHLNESQRAFVAAKLANVPHGGDRSEQAANLPLADEPRATVSQAKAAGLLNVSERSVRAAKAVIDNGAPELQRAVEQGSLPVSAAAQAAKLGEDKQRKIAEEAHAGRANVVRTVIKQETRAIRERELGEKQLAAPEGEFGVILVDWPRRHEVWSRDTGLDRSPDNHYPTEGFEWACALPIDKWAAPDCLLIMCTTPASLIEDIEIAAEWGFCALRPRDGFGKLSRPNGVALPAVGSGTYRSHQVWDKVKRGTGRWFIDRHEMWLILVRGNIPCPAPGTQDESLFSESRGEHSAKPVRLLAWIERHWPNLRKLEVFRRGPARPGWNVWGNEFDADKASGETHDNPDITTLPPHTLGEQSTITATKDSPYEGEG